MEENQADVVDSSESQNYDDTNSPNTEVISEQENESTKDLENVEAAAEEPYKDDPYRALAIHYGWDPTKGDKSPRQFLEYPLDRKIKSQESKIGDLEGRISQLTQLLLDQNKSRVSEDRAYFENILKTSDDADAVRQAHQALSKITEQETHLATKYGDAEKPSGTPAERQVQEFLARHADWYPGVKNPNARLTDFHNGILEYTKQRNTEITKAYPDMPIEDLLSIIEVEVENKFFKNDVTKNVVKPTQPTIRKQGVSGSAGSTYDVSKLEPFDRGMYDKLVKTKLVTESVFFEQLKVAGRY